MWGRVVEIMTATWISVSPFIFGVSSDSMMLWTDQAIALLIWTLSGLSFWRPTRYAYLLNFLVAVFMVLFGRFHATPPMPADQNHIVVGLFLLMIALIPNQASLPPQVWRRPASAS